jgi:hypothetical protein
VSDDDETAHELAERLATAEYVPPPRDREAYERGGEAWLRKVGWRT